MHLIEGDSEAIRWNSKSDEANGGVSCFFCFFPLLPQEALALSTSSSFFFGNRVSTSVIHHSRFHRGNHGMDQGLLAGSVFSLFSSFSLCHFRSFNFPFSSSVHQEILPFIRSHCNEVDFMKNHPSTTIEFQYNFSGI